MGNNIEKIIIQNRKKQKIVLLLENKGGQKGLVFILHGLGGYKEQPHIQILAEVFSGNDYIVIRFDATNALGESGGEYAEASVTTYYEDLEDVIRWSGSQDWYEEPFVLAGHSLGSIAVTLFTERYPEKIKALLPLSTVVSWGLSKETAFYKEVLEKWHTDGYIERTHSKSKEPLRLKWSHVEDLMKYDLLKDVVKLTMPVLMVVGEEDVATPVKHQKILFDAIPGKKELHIIKESPHTFRKPEHLAELNNILEKWISQFG